jgi:hypothetical protein
MVESNDEKSLEKMFLDQISNLIAFKKDDLVSLFNKIGLSVSKNPTNKELSKIISDNIVQNKKLQIGLAYLIAENNDILQQEIKKTRIGDDEINSFEGKKKPKAQVNTQTSTTKPKRNIDINKSADAVTSIAGAISVLADTVTQTKKGQFANDLNTLSNAKSPEDLAKEQESQKLDEAKKKRRRRNIFIGLVVAGVLVTAFVGYKKGWFSKFGSKQ